MLDLYKDLIIDHGLNPRNKRTMTNFTNSAKGFNYFCGDSFNLYLNIIENNVNDISFDGKGCSISIASASLMTLYLKNQSIIEADFLFNYFLSLIKGQININNKFYELNVLAGVNKFPSRVKCATLIWHTLKDALAFNTI